MSSTYNDIRQAIEARLATEMALSPSYPVSYENVPFDPPNNSPWIKAQIRFGLNNYATLLGLSLIHISEPTRPLYISYAVFCLKKKN